MSDRPIAILVAALGGEGGGVLAEWLYRTAVHCSHSAQSTSIPGVAQRTGATTYYIEVCPRPDAEIGPRRPVFGLSPVPGTLDLLVSSELLETARQISLGMTHPARTRVISSTARALTVAEKIPLLDGRFDSVRAIEALQRHARETELHDFAALARQAGTVISAVLLGAIAASGVLPFARQAYEDAVRASGRGVEASLRGFALGFDAVRQQRGRRAVVEAALRAEPPPDLRALARARLTAYQDAAYARLYDERLARVAGAEAADGTADGPVTTEVSRWLALWMAYDDIVRVAALKLAASRLARVRREVDAQPGDVVKIYDHFKPGAAEFASLLPAPLATRLLAWDRRRVAGGQDPWALPLKVAAHSVAGALALRAMASLRPWRRRSSRFAIEQQLIERWLAAVERGTREHAALGLELARCGRLVKGYGSTNERGKENLLHIVDHLATGNRPAADRAEAVRAAREAALADDAGRALDQTLLAHGAPPRPPREQVVRWFKRRPAT